MNIESLKKANQLLNDLLTKEDIKEALSELKIEPQVKRKRLKELKEKGTDNLSKEEMKELLDLLIDLIL